LDRAAPGIAQVPLQVLREVRQVAVLNNTEGSSRELEAFL